MGILTLLKDRLNVVGAFRELGSDTQRRETLVALAFAHLLVQLTFIPVTLTIPSVATQFGVDVDDASWSVIARLLVLGSAVFLAARLGERYGHVRVFYAGVMVLTVSSLLATTAQSLGQLILWSGTGGFGGALVTANANAMLTLVFPSNERGRAFSVPVTASRIGTLIGVVLFGIFLEYVSWRLVFVTSLTVGLLALKLCYPMLKYQYLQAVESRRSVSIDYAGAALLVTTLVVFILSGSHLHEGAESFTSPEALGYHLPMNLLTMALLALFIVIQLRSNNPFLDFRYFRRKYFSMSLFSNTTFHLSMLTIFTLVPIVMEDGLGHSPIVVSMVLLAHQSWGLVLTPIAGMIYDRHNPQWLAPISLFLVATGVALLGLFAASVPVWAIPLLLLPSSIGTSMFISPWNAVVMNSLTENRSFASGMLETTRQMGHTIGTTLAATILGLSLPVTLELVTQSDAQQYYLHGFRNAAFGVIWIIIAGGIVAMFQKLPAAAQRTAPREPAPQPGGDG